MEADRVALGRHEDQAAGRLRMAGDVAQSFTRDREQVVRLVGRQVRLHDAGRFDIDVDHAVDPELLGQGGQAPAEPGLLEQLGAQAEDEVSDVADRRSRDRCPIHSLAGSPGSSPINSVRPSDSPGIDALDDAVVQVAVDLAPSHDRGAGPARGRALLYDAGVRQTSTSRSSSCEPQTAAGWSGTAADRAPGAAGTPSNERISGRGGSRRRGSGRSGHADGAGLGGAPNKPRPWARAPMLASIG
jgi:hypothetical protein